MPIIAIAGIENHMPDWVAQIEAQLGADYRLDRYTRRTGYVSRLTDDLVALILVHAGDDCFFWTATPKSSPATRRIPIFLISDDPQPAALTSGADLVLTPTELMRDLNQLVADFARVQTPEQREQLDCECDEPLPALAQQGVQKFNAREFYKQHHLFEELWMQTDGPVRDLYRAVLQVGVAYYQILRGNHRGALKMLLRSVQWLAILPDECQGINIAALKADSYRVRAELERLPEDHIDQFDTSLLEPVKYKPT